MSLFKMDIEGLKCDNPKCDYKDMSIHWEDYSKWVGRNCPKCGEILLTPDDYKLVVRLKNIENNIFIKILNFVTDKLFFWKNPDRLDLDMNGSGKLFFKNKRNKHKDK